MKLLMCQCRMCKLGRDGGYAQAMIRHKKKSARAKTKRMLRCGQWETLPQAVAIGYTD